MRRVTAAIALVLALAGCSGEEPAANVFQGQTEAIDKAAEVEKLLDDTADRQRRVIDGSGD